MMDWTDFIGKIAPAVHRGTPWRHLRSDNRPEFVDHATLEWFANEHIDTAFIDPGKPCQNDADESFNSKFRDERLSLE